MLYSKVQLFFHQQIFPCLRYLYEHPAHLFCQGSSLLSRTGVHQGCPLGPAAFAVGLHAAALSTRHHGLVCTVFYLDDGLLVGPVDRVREAFRTSSNEMAAVGLAINRRKCALWGPGCPLEGFQQDDVLVGVPSTAYIADSGLKVLGVSVGRPE